MNEKLKRGVYNRLVKAMNQNPNIDGLEKNDSAHFAFSCMICGGICFEFLLRKDAPLLVLKATTPVISGFSDSDDDSALRELGAEVIEGTKFRITTYENKLVFQYALPLMTDDMSDLEKQKYVFNETMNFVHMLCIHKDQLGCNAAGAGVVNMDFTSDAEDDPYGFNDFTDDENDDTPSSSPVFDAPVDNNDAEDFFEQQVSGQKHEEPFTGSFKEDENIFSASMQAGMIQNPEESSEKSSEKYEDMLKAEKELEEQRRKRWMEREERRKNRLESSRDVPLQDEKCDAENPADSEDVFEAEFLKAAEAFEKKDRMPHQIPNEKKYPAAKGDNMDDEDLFGSLSSLTSDHADGNIPAGKRTGVRTAPKAARRKKTAKSDHGFSEKHMDKTRQEDEANEEQNKESKIMNNGYQRAPEVIEQMKHLYAEVDKIFASRKEQADYREAGLNDYAKRLDAREREIAAKGSRLEESFQNRQQELEKQALNFETQKQEISFQWKKLEAEKEAVEEQKKNIEELQALFEKAKELEAAKGDTDDQVYCLRKEIDEKDQAIKELQESAAEASKEHDECIRALNNKIARLQADIAEMPDRDGVQDEIAELRKKTDALAADNKDYQEDIHDLMDEVSRKNGIIETLHEKIGELDGIRAGFAEKERAWKDQEASYKEQIETMRKGSEMNSSIQDDLDAANLKIKQLEAEAKRMQTENPDNTAVIKRLNMELSKTKSDLEKADKAYEEEKALREQLEANAGSQGKDINALAVGIKNSLSEIGIQVEPIATNGELLLSGYSDSAQLLVNVDSGILYVEKPVKSGVKHRAKFEEWNTESIRTSYLFAAKKIICKCVYDDIAKAAMDVIGRFSGLN